MTPCPVQARIDELTDRAHIALKIEAEHKHRSFGQRHRQTCERVARIFAETERRLALIKWRYSSGD